MKKPFIIGITGGSGSGKTTFIRALKESFSKRELCVISQDDYYRPIDEQPIDEQGVVNFDRPRSIDKSAFVGDVKKLLKGKKVERLEYAFNKAGADRKMLVFRPTPIILVEGIFAFHFKKMQPLLDMKIFLDAKENLKVIRRIKRDRVERDIPLETVLYQYEHHVMPTFEKYILPYRAKADIIINNNKQMERGLMMVKGFIRDYLRLE
ncbi:MAG: P-loop NTPase fold protein [Bacteroidota bacterium]